MIDRLMMIFTNTYVKKMITASGKHGVNDIVLQSEMYKYN